MFAALKAMLINNADVAAMIGDRIYPGVVPESEPLPAISAWSQRTDRDEPQDSGGGIYQQTWQINCLHHSSMDVSLLADAVEAALHRQSASGITLAIVTNRMDDPPDLFDIRRVIIEAQLTRSN